MRHDLLCFGTVLSLDGQKKQYNKFNWPYIGPVVKDGENRVRVVCESLLVSEDREGYVFVLNSLAEMEPRWCLSSIKFIFADHLFNIEILRDLKIEDTCVLRGDHYHLLQEVWPKFFGQTVFRQISFQQVHNDSWMSSDRYIVAEGDTYDHAVHSLHCVALRVRVIIYFYF